MLILWKFLKENGYLHIKDFKREKNDEEYKSRNNI